MASIQLEQQSVIITVASFKGGVGKTTSAIHLACYLSQQGSTLLVDSHLAPKKIDTLKSPSINTKTLI